MPERILVTGGAGRIGTLMRNRLARPDRVLRFLDVAPQPPAGEGARIALVTASITDVVCGIAVALQPRSTQYPGRGSATSSMRVIHFGIFMP